jgi:hypothetical protein
MSNGERVIKVEDADLSIEPFGCRTGPAVRLVHGACASMLWWQTTPHERVAADGRTLTFVTSVPGDDALPSMSEEFVQATSRQPDTPNARDMEDYIVDVMKASAATSPNLDPLWETFVAKGFEHTASPVPL